MGNTSSKSASVTQPGWVVMQKVEGSRKTAGGIVISTPHPELKGSIDKLVYGIVVDCGLFCDYQGKLFQDFPGFPLPKGTYIEVRVMNPWVTLDQYLVIKTSDIIRSSATQPDWWPN